MDDSMYDVEDGSDFAPEPVSIHGLSFIHFH